MCGAHFQADAGSLRLGESKDVEIQIRTAASHFMQHVVPGTSFLMMEGSRPVGDGIVTDIYRTDD